jgi:predicted alpha/beta-hydrolase family hydrolase
MNDAVLRSGSGDGAHLLLFAHGSVEPMDEGLMEHLAVGIAEQGVDVARFEFPFMHARRKGGGAPPPDSDSILIRHFESVASKLAHRGRLVVGGWSLGCRIAARVADSTGAARLVCVGYPFHPVGKPASKTALETIRRVRIPTLVLQGSRDPFGNREQVRGYRLVDPIKLHWLEDGNHALVPRTKSGHTYAGHIRASVKEIVHFIRRA